MRITVSRLRENIYRLLDQVLETGEPLEVERNGRLLRIVPVDPAVRPGLLERLFPRPDWITGDPEDLVHIDWSSEWRP
jgi:antitoxin (DNA-binding transcriptional repressor) of toxin-antitoxin stability system